MSNKRTSSKYGGKLCDCNTERILISVSIKRRDPVGHAQLFKDYETCADCATCLTTGDMDKSIKKALEGIIRKNRR